MCRHLDARYTANLVPYLTHHPVYPMWTMIPSTCNVIIAPNIQALIFNWICLRGYWRYVDNSMLLILQTWCQIQLTIARLRYVNCCPGHIQCNYSSAYSGFNSQLNVYPSLLEICREFNAPYTATWCQIQRTSSRFRYVNCDHGHIQCIYSSAYSGVNNQLNVSALLLEICRQFSAPYTAILVPNTAHILQNTLSELLSRSYAM
jgi:hypothetical protein